MKRGCFHVFEKDPCELTPYVNHIMQVDDSEEDSNFFMHPPPQVPYENFSKLNLSRPILRVTSYSLFTKVNAMGIF